MGRVLIVEDEVQIADLLRDFLALEFPDLEIMVVHTIAEALDQIGDDWDLCICDCILPDGVACDLVKRIRKVPVIVTTGYVDEDRLAEARGVHQNLVVLRKPYTLDRLAEKVRELLSP